MHEYNALIAHPSSAHSTATARLSPASLGSLKTIGDGDLGEFTVAFAALCFLLWKYFQNLHILVETPHSAEPLLVEIRPDESIENFLTRIAGIIEDSYTHSVIDSVPSQATKAIIIDDRLHNELRETDGGALLFHLHLAEGEIEIRYSAQGYETFLIERFSETLAQLFPQFQRFGAAVRDIDSLSSEDQRYFAAFNETTTPFEHPATVVGMFEAQVSRTPSEPALIDDKSITTYTELNEKANRLAHRLIDSHHIGPESMVGIMLDRSELMIVAVLGVLKAGAAFVPIESSYPLDRVNYILSDTAVSLLITQSNLLAQWIEFSGALLAIDVESSGWLELSDNPVPLARPEHLAYVIYTSGSTGEPKGCLLEHGNIANYIAWAQDYYFPDRTGGNFGLYSSLCFDFTLTNIFCPLVTGKSLRIYPQSQSIEAILAHAFRADSGVDTLKLTPSHIRLLEYMDLGPTGVRKIIAGGEELTPVHISILRRIDPTIEIYNEYGPTEATVGCIAKRIDVDFSQVLIGAPIANTRVYILDEAGKAVPLGVRGEICVAGAGLARGYHQRPDVTAQKFIRDAFPGEHRIYRTGDIGRWLPSGDVQCFGRMDDQVKIRGYRVELGEIEVLLSREAGVYDAAVVLREDARGSRKLVAYIKGNAQVTAAELRASLAAKLPDYMVPVEILFLPEFPLNANGKVDRSAFPVPEQHGCFASANANPIQTALLGIWRDVFGAQTIAITDRFFALGGDSLIAVQLISRLWNAFSVDVSIDDIFELQTIEAIAGLIDATTQITPQRAHTTISKRSENAEIPLSFAQQRLWFLWQLEGPNAAYNLSSALRLKGDLDVAKLENAIAEISRRHEILRTTFPDINGRPTQKIAPHATARLSVIPVAHEADAHKLAAETATQPFDLAAGPLYRATLYRIESRVHVLAITMHHIISDAWSSTILVRELSALYRSESLPDLSIQYADYALWQREQLESANAREHLAFLTASLAGIPDLLELPADRPRPAVQTSNGSVISLHLDPTVASHLHALAHASGATVFMVLLAGYAAFLSRYSGQKDVVIGSPVANRSLPEIEPLIGFFVNTLALRINLAGNPTFRELLARVRQVALDCYARQEIPFERIVDSLQLDRNLSRSPVFQVMFAYENASPDTLILPGITASAIDLETKTSKFDLTFYVQDSGSAITGALEFNTDLFDHATAARMANHISTLLAAIAATPDASLSTLPLLSLEEHHRVAIEWNQTAIGYPDTPIHNLFEQQVERNPDAVAVTFEDDSLTYHELNSRANGLARQLIMAGVAPDSLVGVSMERSLEMIVTLLAVLKAGAAYVPIDPDDPAERVRFMLENSGTRWLLAQRHLAASLPPGRAQTIIVDQSTLAPSVNAAPAATPANLAYMIYTSGSTGRPKGALNTHRALTNRILWMQDAYHLTPADAVLQKTPFSFDVSVWEFFWPLITGARLVFARPGGQRETDYLVDVIARNRITTLHFVPSMLRAFLDDPGLNRCTSLRRVICSGEALPLDLQQKFFERVPAELHNLYGPTEAAVDVTFWKCCLNDSRRSVPIGRPIANTRIYIVDESLQPSPIGVPGELLIGGIAVGRGYYNEPELTAEKFIPDPFADHHEARLYRTGDLARFCPDGVIEFLGRIDHQVKIRGFRIELGEIEENLRAHPAIADCVVIAQTDSGNTRLIAYLASQGVDIGGLRDFLKARVPGYMVPSLFIRLDALPLLPNGKIDRKALPSSVNFAESKPAAESTLSPRQKLFADIWQEVLQLPAVGIHDNFFELGGDSILAIQVVARANRAGLRISAKQIFEHQTIAGLSTAPENENSKTSSVDPTGEAPLTPVQLWFVNQRLPDPGRFTQSVLLDVPGDLDAALLARAVDRIYAHHDALRLRLSSAGSQHIDPVLARPIFAIETITSPDYVAAISHAALKAEATIDLTEGPLIAVRLLRMPEDNSARLFIGVHHLAIDGVSWRILLEDLHAAYEQSPLPPKTTSFREWAFRLRELAKSPTLAAQASFWLDLLSRTPPLIPRDDPTASNHAADTATVSFTLEETETTALLRLVAHTYNARINEILLTALALAFRKTIGTNRLLLDFERHGREEFGDEIDLSRTVGWFTNISPVLLDLDPTLSPPNALQSVKQQLTRMNEAGFAYPLLRFLAPDETIRGSFANLPQPEILFNYHGQIDAALPRGADWRLASEDVESHGSLTAPRTHLFEIIAVVSESKLKVDWLYSHRIHLQSTVELFASNFKAQLRALIHSRLLIANPGRIEDAYGLSPLQQGILFHALYERNPAAYFQQFSFAIEGPLATDALRAAWLNAIDRHAILRTAFVWQDLEEPVQIVFRSVDLAWESHDWCSVAEDDRAKAFEDLLARDRQRGFNLKQPPLFRCTLIREAEREYRFLWSTHHLLLDGWSAAILMREIFEDYIALVRSETPAGHAAPRPYRDYILWLARQSRAASENWWRTELKDFRMPVTLPGNSAVSGLGDKREEALLLDERLTAQLSAQVRVHRLTWNVLLRGVWALLLSRYSNTSDVVFGVTISGRPPEIEGIESMVGLFINTLPARFHIDPNEPFLDLLAKIQAKQPAMDLHGWSSLVDIQKWSEVCPGTGLFDSLNVFENYPVAAPAGLDPSEFQIRDVRSFDETNYPLTLTAVPGERFQIRLSYDTLRLQSDAVQRMLGHISTVLEEFLTNAFRPCGELNILSAAERETLLYAFNTTDAPFDGATTFVHLIEATASASDFNKRANRLAYHLLRRADLEPDDLVALIAHRSERMADAILAIWKCGAAYVPIDPQYPAARISAILDQARPRLIVTESEVLDAIPTAAPPIVLLDELDEGSQQDSANLNRPIDPGNLAYVIFTSGSTGAPKGAMIEHAGMLNHLLAKVDDLAIGPDSVVAQTASHCFDISIWQFFAGPLAGARTVVIEDDVILDPARFLGVLDATGVTILEVVPSYLALLLERPEAERAALAKLDVLLVTGETTSTALVDRWFRSYPHVPVVNAYGPTEAADDITLQRFSHPPDTVSLPVGKPIRNLRIYVVDEQMNLCPMEIPGEICVSGVGVGRGYLNDEVRTKTAFIEDPFRPERGVRMYRTGDTGYFGVDGTLFLTGRKDHQVKIRGHRIELGEVENALERLPEIARAVVVPHAESLIAYVTTTGGHPIQPDAIRRALARQIPAYMTPQTFVPVEALPLTTNGKVDRAALSRAVAVSAPSKSAHQQPRTPEEKTLHEIWEEVLGQTGISITDDYFDLGGHSILAVRLMAKIERAFHRRLPIAQLFRNPTIEKLGATLGDNAPRPASAGLVEIRPGSEASPLFLIPGAGGNVIYFHALSKRLAPGRAVYGLEAPGLDGSEPLATVEEIAAHHIRLISPVVGTGPYLLAGHSFGASVALEMSRQLIANGAFVDLLAIFDAPAPISIAETYWHDWDDVDWLVAIAHEIGSFLGVDLRITREQLEILDPEAQLAHIIERIAAEGDWFQDTEPDRLRAFLRVYKANSETGYAPSLGPLDLRIALFRSSEKEAGEYDPSPEVALLRQDPAWGWSRFSCFNVAIKDVPGTHLSMLLEPNVSILARQLDSLFEEGRIKRRTQIAHANDR